MQSLGEIIAPESHDNSCPHCQFGVVQQPQYIGRKIASCPPLWALRAMLRDLGGLCHIVYCTCPHGQAADKFDAANRAILDSIGSVTVIENADHHTCYDWGTEAPYDYIPGSWWVAAHEIAKNPNPEED